jgi:ribonuclease G
VSLWIERDMWRKIEEPGNAFLIQCHPSVVEALIGADGENFEELEHEMRRGLYIRANFDMEFDEYEITSGNIESFDRDWMNMRRAQVVEVNVRRSSFEHLSKVIAWTDGGYFVELTEGSDLIGQRAKVSLLDIRRSFAVAEMIMSGSPSYSRGMA